MNGRIAYEMYVEYVDENGWPRSSTDLFSSELDGTDEVNLTNTDGVEDLDPAWSPDGTQILYQVNYYEPEIWVVEAPPPPQGGVSEGLGAAPSDANAAAPPAGGRNKPVKIGAGGSPSWQPVISSERCTVLGTAKDDVLVGTDGPDVICGLGGNDVLRAKGAGDRLLGGGGSDSLYGAAGRDRPRGGPGADRLDGGKGNDRCDGVSDTDPPISCERPL